MTAMRRSLTVVLCFLVAALSVPLTARQPLRARHGMAVAMEAQAADVGVAVLKPAATPWTPRSRWASPWPPRIRSPATSAAAASC
jgi:hypothetical protein